MHRCVRQITVGFAIQLTCNLVVSLLCAEEERSFPCCHNISVVNEVTDGDSEWCLLFVAK